MRDLGNKHVMSKNIKRLMAEKNVKAKRMSQELDIPYTTLLSWLKADNYPRIDKIEAMAAYFGVLKSELIEEKMTEEKEKDNEILADIIVRMRTDDAFCSLVQSLYLYDSAKIESIKQLLHAFDK